MSSPVSRLPCRVWPTGGVPAAVVDALRNALVADALVESGTHGPAIVLVAAHEVVAGGVALRDRLNAASPGRPVLLGGTSDRAVLTAAINHLRVVRVVPESAPVSALRAAVLAAHETLEIDVSTQLAIDALRTETARLGTALEALKTSQADLLHAERLSTLGRLARALIAAMTAHQADLEQYLGGVRDHLGDPELQRISELARTGTASIASLLREIDAFARNERSEHTPIRQPIRDVVDTAVTFARCDELCSGRTLTVEHADPRAEAPIDRFGVYHVLLNLIRNAVQATRPGGLVEVRTSATDAHVEIEVQDNGTGMPKVVRDQLFTPFFTTRGVHGLGLGLRTARAAVERHGGSLTLASELGRGTTVTVRFPRSWRSDE